MDKLESKVVSVVKESIASQMSTNFESAKLGQFKDAYCKLQKSVEEISAKISNLSQQNSNLQMDIDTASESLSDSVKSRPVLLSVSPSITALSIADELADRERRKNNIIVYNFMETSDHQTDKDSFVNFCSYILTAMLKSVKYCTWGRKYQINTGPYCWVLSMMMTNFQSFLVHIYCITMINIVMYLLFLTELNLKGKT